MAGEGMPLLLDDPFQQLDPSVKPLLLELLGRSAGEPQIVFLTEDEDVASLGPPRGAHRRGRAHRAGSRARRARHRPAHAHAGRTPVARPAAGRLPPMELRLATLDDAEAHPGDLQPRGDHLDGHVRPRARGRLEEQRAWLAERSGARAVLVAERRRRGLRVRLAVAVARPTRLRHHRRGLGVRAPRPPGPGRRAAAARRARRHRHRPRVPRLHGAHRRRARRVDRACTRRCGFEVVGTEREVGRKFGRWLDVVLMERLLT